MTSLIFDNVGKRYLLAKQKAPAERSTFNLGVGRLTLPRFTWTAPYNPAQELWALREVSFALDQGTVLGLIGPNGAGKSTLLKLVARITRPTEGCVSGHGRVVSLLELGAGFNPDFSARENIFMNAAMHGIRRREVLARLDDIIQFAEIERFIDSPVKHFSSGMYLRLAFSVAINMQPDILLADEILAVGDAAFQERCLLRVAHEARQGLTVFFVSHDMQSVARICNRVLWLEKGRLVGIGDTADTVADYQAAALGSTQVSGARATGQHASVNAEIMSVRLLNAAGAVVGAVPLTEESFLRIRVKVEKADVGVRAIVDVSVKGTFLFRAAQSDEVLSHQRAVVDLMLRLPAHLLAETSYSIGVTVLVRRNTKQSRISIQNALSFVAYGAEYSGDYRPGLIAPRLEWSATNHGSVSGPASPFQPSLEGTPAGSGPAPTRAAADAAADATAGRIRAAESAAWRITPDLRPRAGERLEELWRYRRILWFFAVKSVEALYSKTRLAPVWLVIRALAPIVVSSVVFSTVLKIASPGVPYFLFLLVGWTLWNFFDGPLIYGSRSLEVNRRLLTKLYIPRLILPVGQLSAGLVEPLICVMALVAAVFYYRVTAGVWYVVVSPRLGVALLAVVLALVLAFSLSLWTSIWMARARDTRYVLMYGLSFWALLTPILYPADQLPRLARRVAMINPMFGPVEAFKWGVLGTGDLPVAGLTTSCVFAVVTLVLGLAYFSHVEEHTVDRL